MFLPWLSKIWKPWPPLLHYSEISLMTLPSEAPANSFPQSPTQINNVPSLISAIRTEETKFDWSDGRKRRNNPRQPGRNICTKMFQLDVKECDWEASVVHGFFAKLYTLLGIQQLRLNRITNKIAKHTYVANLNRCRGSSNALNKTLLVFKWLGLNFVSEPSEIKFTSIIQRPYLPVNRVGGTNSRGPVEAQRQDSSSRYPGQTYSCSLRPSRWNIVEH